jgi:hypothetical protein
MMPAMGRRLRAGVFAAAILMAASPVHAAQQGNKDLEELRRQEVDDAYKAAVERSKIMTPKRTVDPWGAVRDTAPAPKTPATGDVKSGHP